MRKSIILMLTYINLTLLLSFPATPVIAQANFWQQTNGPFGGTVNALAINSNGEIFAGTGAGVFRSSDNGDNWTQINTGLTNTDVFALAFNSDGQVFAGTRGGGVFRSVGSTTAVEEISSSIPSSFALEQNYPNPFNPTTTIQFTLAKGANVKLKVFSIEGKEVATLVDETLTPGVHTFRFEANGLPSGVYFYRLTTGRFVETRKLTLLK